MSNPNIEKFGNSIPEILPVTPVSPKNGTKKTSTKTDDSGASTISKSEEAGIKLTIDAALPMLSFPLIMPTNLSQFFVAGNAEEGVSALTFEVENRKNKIIMSMLDSWLDAIKKEADRREEEKHAPMYLQWKEKILDDEKIREKTKLSVMTSSEYQAWIASLMASKPIDNAPSGISKDSIRIGLVSSLENYMRQIRDNPDPAVTVTLPFMAASFVIGVTSMGEIATASVVGGPENAAKGGIQQIVSLISDDARDDLGLIGALFAQGLVYRSIVETIAGEAVGKEEKGKAFARNYSRAVMKLVAGEELNQFINGLLSDKLSNGKPMKESRKQELTLIVKIVLLCTALAVMYKSETGAITGQEFAELLKPDGKIPLAPDDMKTRLVQMIRTLLSALPESERAKLLNNLIAYMDRNDNIDFMIKPANVFEKVFTDFKEKGDLPA